jgi:tRNA(Ile)-lysidine synthase TilS/MesJ
MEVLMQRLLSRVRRCAEDFDMIKPGDKIAVGLSAGKDSLSTLWSLAQLRRFYPVPFELKAVTIDMGMGGMDFSPVMEFCKELDVDYTIVPTQISKIIFDIRKEENPCSLCAKMRRGALNEAAMSVGCIRSRLAIILTTLSRPL